MRHLLVNHAEQQQALNRGGDVERVLLATLHRRDREPATVIATAREVLALNEAMELFEIASQRLTAN